MPASLQLLVCKHYLREAQAILNSVGFEDVTVSSYPDICTQPRADRIAAMERLFAESGGDGRTVILVGACYLLRNGTGVLKDDRFHRVHREDLCFYMLLNRALVDSYLRLGAHLVTSGWLVNWRQHIDDWQFDRQTAQAFFAEGARKLVLLDTGVDPEGETHLRDCADFIGLPAEVVPVGLEHFRLLLTQMIQTWRTEEAQRLSDAASAQANRKLADYLMAMDLLVKLARIMDEKEAIQAILELATMLFGADRVAYISTEGDRYETTHRGDRAPDDTGWAQSWVDRLKPDDAYVSADTGFCVRVMYQSATLGLLIVDSISLPQHKQDYLNLAINVISVCGLAITNARSISRRQLAEKELTLKSEELARSNADLDEFAHVVSHDLQAPLGMIIVMGDLLRNEGAVCLNDTGRNGIDSIQKCARRMKNLIDGLLSYARVKKSGKAFVVVPLANPVQQAVTDLAKSIQETGAKVEVDALPTVFGDELQLYQLFLNLIGNAVKFVPAGRAPRVHLSSRSVDKGMMEISVSDNGIGFDEKDVDKMFQPFQRLQTQQAYSGSGIGLAVCQKIVQRHGGAITARSRLGEGSTFLVTLPQH